MIYIFLYNDIVSRCSFIHYEIEYQIESNVCLITVRDLPRVTRETRIETKYISLPWRLSFSSTFTSVPSLLLRLPCPEFRVMEALWQVKGQMEIDKCFLQHPDSHGEMGCIAEVVSRGQSLQEKGLSD